ncbi:MAG: energy transducer TonB, partial [Pseudomonadota bacterium]|nr:energy transducer TonB [Pseudomonadota bacterium]
VLAALPKSYEDVPDVDFGGEAMKSPVTGGAAKATYFSMLYGLVVPRMHVPAIAHAYGRRLKGVVAFVVDGRGRLTQRFVVESSGSLELDEAAMRAVAEASHSFPPPPHKAPIGMRFTYTVN